MCLEKLDIEQCMSDVCVFHLIENGRVLITAVVHVDDIFAAGLNNRCDISCVISYLSLIGYINIG